MLKQSNTVAGVFEFVNVSPNLGLPSLVVSGGLAARGATGVEGGGKVLGADGNCSVEFDEDAADFFDLIVWAEKMLVAEEVSETQLSGFEFRLGTGMEGSVLGPQLLGRIARHPEGFFVRHRWFRPGMRSRLVAAEPLRVLVQFWDRRGKRLMHFVFYNLLSLPILPAQAY